MRGFSLTEVLIVIGIAAFLVALSLPAYRDYSIRGKVLHAFETISRIKLDIEENFVVFNTFPNETIASTDSSAYKDFSNHPYIQQIRPNSGCAATYRFAVYFKSDLGYSNTSGTQAVIFGAELVDDGINWRCAPFSVSDGIPTKYLPNFCDSDTTSWPSC